MPKKRDDIPRPIRREVRQRCGFGCVICGIPLYEYDHIINFSIVQKHEAENLTLLCKQHHTEKTNKLLSIAQLNDANSNPYNIVNNLSTPYLLNFYGDNFKIVLGDITLTIPNINSENDLLVPFLINNKKILSFEIIDGIIYFNLVLFDEKGRLLFRVEQNELIFNRFLWDIEFVAQRLIIREGLRKIIFDIEFLIPDNTVKINKAYFNCDGYRFVVNNNGILTTGFEIQIKNIIGRLIFAAGNYNGQHSQIFRC